MLVDILKRNLHKACKFIRLFVPGYILPQGIKDTGCDRRV